MRWRQRLEWSGISTSLRFPIADESRGFCDFSQNHLVIASPGATTGCSDLPEWIGTNLVLTSRNQGRFRQCFAISANSEMRPRPIGPVTTSEYQHVQNCE